jgi:hypothetical protein
MRTKPTELTCTICGTATAMPAPGDYPSMWDAGWRWRGDPEEKPIRFMPKRFIYSCPEHN